jgi:integrase
MDELLQKLKDGNLTIAEAFELGRPNIKLYKNDGKKSAFLNRLEEAGFSLEDNWDSMGNRDKHDILNKIGGSPDYLTLSKVEGSLTKLAASEDFDYPYSNRFEAGKGTIRTATVKGDPTKLRFDKATQPRGDEAAKKITLPSVEDLNKAIHATTLKLKDNKEAVAFFQLKHLLGIRNRDLINLTVGEAIEDSPFGTLDPGSNTLYGISNKGNRTNYQLPSLAQDILADLGTDAKGRMGDNKSVKLFNQSEAKLRTLVNNAMNETMSEMGLDITDQKTNKKIPFTISDLRKNVFDVINDEEGPGVANLVLGHSTRGDVGLTHYKVDRKSRRKMSLQLKAAEEFANLYLQDINQVNPKNLYGTYGFNKDFFKESSVIAFDAPSDPLSQKSRDTTLKLEGTAADVNKTANVLTKQVEGKVSNLTKQVAKLQTLNEQMSKLTSSDAPKKEPKKKAPPKGSAIILDDKAKSAFSKAWDILSDKGTKVIAGALGVEAVRQFVDNPAQAAQDIGTELLLERGLGLGPGAAVGFAMQSSPAGAGSDIVATDPTAEFKTISEDDYANMTSMGLETSKQDMATTNPMNYAMDQQMSDLLRKDIPDKQGIM